MLLLLNLCIFILILIQIFEWSTFLCFARIGFCVVRYAAVHAERMRTVSWYINL
jgi:hypothetical protein